MLLWWRGIFVARARFVGVTHHTVLQNRCALSAARSAQRAGGGIAGRDVLGRRKQGGREGRYSAQRATAQHNRG